jgi:hypothetical protein
MGPHINPIAAKAASHIALITRWMKSTGGAMSAKARQIYAAVVRLVLSYGCLVWSSLGDERANQNKLIYPLQTVQNKSLRTIMGAYETANIQVLEHEARVAPLEMRLGMLVINHVQRTEDSTGDQTTFGSSRRWYDVSGVIPNEARSFGALVRLKQLMESCYTLLFLGPEHRFNLVYKATKIAAVTDKT